MHQLGLQFLQARFGLLPLGQVADKAGEEASVTRFHFADRKLDREGRAVLALADDHAANADDAAFARVHIPAHVTVMVFTIGGGHQSLDVLSDDLGSLVAEQPLGGAAERLHDAALVDDDHGFRHGVENRLQMGLARQCVARHYARAPAAAMQQLANPGHADADHAECRAVGHGGG